MAKRFGFQDAEVVLKGHLLYDIRVYLQGHRAITDLLEGLEGVKHNFRAFLTHLPLRPSKMLELYDQCAQDPKGNACYMPTIYRYALHKQWQF